MSDQQLLGNDVFAAFEKNLRSKGEDDSYTLRLYQPYVEALPAILRDYLQNSVTYQVLLEAKAIFMRYCLDHGILDRALELLLSEQAVMFGENDFFRIWRNTLLCTIKEFEDLSKSSLSIPARRGNTEEATILSNPLGLSANLMQRYQSNDLTLEDILREQPELIVLDIN